MELNQETEEKSSSVLDFRAQDGRRPDLKAGDFQTLAIVINCVCIIYLHQSNIAKLGFYWLIVFVTMQDYLRTSRGVKLIECSPPFSTSSPKCNPVYWVWETWTWAHSHRAQARSFVNSKHPIAVSRDMDLRNMNQSSRSSSAVLCSPCLPLSFCCLAAWLHLCIEKVCTVDLGQGFLYNWNLHI